MLLDLLALLPEEYVLNVSMTHTANPNDLLATPVPKPVLAVLPTTTVQLDTIVALETFAKLKSFI